MISIDDSDEFDAVNKVNDTVNKIRKDLNKLAEGMNVSNSHTKIEEKIW